MYIIWKLRSIEFSLIIYFYFHDFFSTLQSILRSKMVEWFIHSSPFPFYMLERLILTGQIILSSCLVSKLSDKICYKIFKSKKSVIVMRPFISVMLLTPLCLYIISWESSKNITNFLLLSTLSYVLF